MSDRIELQEPALFSLADVFEVEAEGAILEPLGVVFSGIRDYRIEPTGEGPVVIKYSGRVEQGAADIFDMPRAVVDEKGVFLDASSAWYPLFRENQVGFDMTVSLPDGWSLVGQAPAKALGENRFRVSPRHPQEDIYLLAGPYEVYGKADTSLPLRVYLLQPDEDLAKRYLDAMESYIEFYSELIGDYPHDGFSVVENRWQTGYGMPGFTLLGSRVLRLPFLLKTSLPHEILHNWFGNGVYVDAARGNWSEGLTAYLADYLVAESEGRGRSHRLRLLARYTDFAAEGRDIPVAEFRARHDEASQAVGYDKVQMLLHMLRELVGDEAFIEGVRRFYAENRYERADFMDFLEAFDSDAIDIEILHAAWIERAGAPAVRISDWQVERLEDAYRLTLTLEQTQGGEPFPLNVPLYVTLDGEAVARRAVVELNSVRRTLTIKFDKQPLRLDLDPAFEIFRVLSPLERPSTLGRLFGASRQWLVIPSSASGKIQKAWLELAEAWSRRYGNVETTLDTEAGRIPEGDAVWLLGWNNQRLAAMGERLVGAGQGFSEDGLTIDGESFRREQHAAVLLDPDNARPPLGFIGAEDVTVIRRLAGKLTHYGSFGRMAFQLPGLKNLRRDRLAVLHSPLSQTLVEDAPLLRLPPESALANQVDSSLPH